MKSFEDSAVKKVSSETVVLVGLPGSGKTSVGKALHEQHSWSWIDVDVEVERSTGRSIAELIRVEGEQLFRAEESKLLQQALKSGVQVVSVGGGALMREDNRDALKKGALVVHLQVSEDVAAMRVLEDEQSQHASGVKRPVLFNRDGEINFKSALAGMQKLSREREKNFEIAQLKVWTDFSDPLKIAALVVRERGCNKPAEPNKQALVIIPDGSTDTLSEIMLGSSADELPEKLKLIFGTPKTAALVYDANVKALAEKISAGMQKAGFNCLLLEVPSGEPSKNIEQLSRLIDKLVEKGMTRGDFVVGIGGGVVGDISGLLAALYMRGVSHVQVPTTVVAQVDSAIGGKNAVNTPRAKNLVGTFHLPRLVFSSADCLKTLPEREYLSGLGEVVKYGAIFSKDFFEWLEENAELIRQRNPAVLSRIIEFCSVSKTGVVAKDLFDVKGLRALLNFGHTVGHAIEKLAKYGTLLHGEAIAIGMIEATHLGERIGLTPKNTVSRVALLLQKLGLPTEIPSELLVGAKEFLKSEAVADEGSIIRQRAEFEDSGSKNSKADKPAREGPAAEFEQKWLSALKADKKRDNDLVNFILLEDVGAARVVQVELENLVRSVAFGRK